MLGSEGPPERVGFAATLRGMATGQVGIGMKRHFLLMVAALALMGMSAMVVGPAGAVTRSQLQAKVLSLSNLPSGWRAENPSGGTDTYTGCLRTLHTSPKGVGSANAFYVHGNSAPAVGEVLANGDEALRRYQLLNKVLSTCKKLGGTEDGVQIKGTVSAISFPDVGTRSRAYAVSLSVGGLSISADVITFEVGEYAGELLFEDIGQPAIAQVVSFADEAVAKVEGKPVTPFKNTQNPSGHLN